MRSSVTNDSIAGTMLDMVSGLFVGEAYADPIFPNPQGVHSLGVVFLL
jgi:hypothetical protein